MQAMSYCRADERSHEHRGMSADKKMRKQISKHIKYKTKQNIEVRKGETGNIYSR